MPKLLLRHGAFLALLVLIAVIVRAPALGSRSWWIDELITRDIGRLPFWAPGTVTLANRFHHSICAFALSDTGPGPFTYLLEGMFSRWAEPVTGEHWLRLPGVSVGVLTVAALYLVCIGLGLSSATAFTAGALAALFPLWVQWSTGARGYAWGVAAVLLQIWCAGRLVLQRERPVVAILGLAVASVVGLLLHPFHAPFNFALFAALVLATVTTSSRWRIAGAAVAVALFHALYFLTWVGNLRELNQSFGPRLTVESIGPAVIRLVQQRWALVLLFLCMVGTGVALAIRSRQAIWRFHGTLAAATALACVVLAAFLAVRFYPASRYFYFATVPAFIMLAYFINVGFSKLSGRATGRGFMVGLVVVHMVLISCAMWPLRKMANTPEHDWRNGVLWLKQRVQGEDVVLTGPNSDHAIFRAYAAAVQVPAHSPLTISNPQGRRLGVHEPEAVEALLNSGRRIWMITPFLGQHRSPHYWQVITSNLHEVARFPGRADVVVLSNVTSAEPRLRVSH